MRSATIPAARVLDLLPAEAPCLGAVFMSFGFDPAFFEDHVLRAVLRLASDPVEQHERYFAEARRALQATPVASIVDAGRRRPGRRLPYDLLEVSETLFHPKSALLLYEDFARLSIGSGNLTRTGYFENTELFFIRDLRFDSAADAQLLWEYRDHLERVIPFVRHMGSQIDLVREELHRRMKPRPSPAGTAAVRLLDSIGSPLLGQFLELLPENAIIESIGLLAPFYERDGLPGEDWHSVFGELVSRSSPSTVFDIGVSWENPQLRPSEATVSLEFGVGHLWAWESGETGARSLEYVTPTDIGPKSLTYLDQSGKSRRRHLDDVHADIEAGLFWMLPDPVIYAPKTALEGLRADCGEVRVWLHPSLKEVDGRPTHRPLHAKLLLVAFRDGRSEGTLALIGSPNMSRRALLQRAGAGGGNVESAVVFRLEGLRSIRDFSRELVYAPLSSLQLEEREYPELQPSYALAVESAVHDAAANTLRVVWSASASTLRNWTLSYDRKELVSAEEPPVDPVLVSEFALTTGVAEVLLHVSGNDYSVPILVVDLATLPAAPDCPSVDLETLLMLLGRRIGGERAVQIASRLVAPPGVLGDLDVFFGDGFSPTDVFRAWWAVATKLEDPSLSVPAFRLELVGALGAGAAWKAMLDSMRDGIKLYPSDTWFYGAELRRTLAEVTIPDGASRLAKEAVLRSFFAQLETDLDSICIDDSGRPWMQRIRAFYSEGAK